MDQDPQLRTLIDQLRDGESTEENFQQLVQRFRPRLQRFFLRQGLKPEESQDLTQETFLRIYSNISAFRREARFQSWLFSIATNVFRQYLRRRSAAKRSGQEMPLDEMETPASPREPPAAGLPIGLTGQRRDPESALLDGERTRSLLAAVQALPQRMRQCLILRSFQELSYEEIAVTLRLSPETVRSHLFQARRRLRDELSRESTDAGATSAGGDHG
ncbi:MAG: sigma-70 family RNA polymerase sigma factor [Acidobacteriota bacterium]|nr:sigma-70 family RNA polymerase sigma factor [Acidobacteriota bacterium]